ncbi:MAG: UDP-N-acetylmuramate--L-alanine ligase [Bacteroidales bacterium]|nr:UDP-N-acetylmuramate--L-alanine ligase [Bacteroidales bacterium]
MNFADIERIYFIGAGGIGMSALARYFNAVGKKVAGYDKTPSALTDQLIREGIDIHFDDSVDNIPEPYRKKKRTLIIMTPAIPDDHTELNYFRKNAYPLLKRAELLGLITRNKKTIAVAGTHGKTTITTMISWIMSHTSESCTAFLGGISKNFNSNLVLNSQSEWIIAEADEYDRSFLHLYPYAAVITAMDADHLDIYGNLQELHKSFHSFITQVNPDGFLVIKKGLPVDETVADCRIVKYSLNEETDYYASDIRLNKAIYTFDVNTPDNIIRSVSLNHPGWVNVENAVAATALCHQLGYDESIIRDSLATFSGSQRRFDHILKTDKLVFIDDYAHHPREIEATVMSVKELYPGKRITGIFQPHLYSRTRDLAAAFAQSLSLLDELILLEIYPARESPIEGISAESILKHVTISNKMICKKADLLKVLQGREIEVLITMGAGDIDRLVEEIKNIYS